MSPVPRSDTTPGRAPGARLLSACAAVCVALSCSVGQGTGEATGEVHLPDCGVENLEYSLAPSFFAAEFIEDPATRTPGGVQRMVILRMQRGSYRESESDGISIFLRDVNEITTSLLAVPIEIGTGDDAMAQMTLHLGHTCEIGFPRSRYWTVPGVLEAVSGTLVLDAVYAPGLPATDGAAVGEFRGAFTDVRFEDPLEPDTRFAVLDGSFAFFYQRGRPAQRYP